MDTAHSSTSPDPSAPADGAEPEDRAEAPAPDLADVRMVIVGAGNMGGAFARAARAAGIGEENLRLVNSTPESSRRAAQEHGGTAGTSDDVAEADVVVIGVKPYQLADTLPELARDLRADALVISLAAGTSLAQLDELLGGHRALVRALPNTPIAIGQGVTHLIAGPDVPEPSLALARAVLAGSGLVVELGEDKGHALIGAAGSGVAFVYTVIDAMVDEAVRQGIPRPEATRVIAQTVQGAASLIQETGTHPALARSAVMSPGGTTAEGLAALDAHGLRPALSAAMRAAAARSRELSGE